MKSNLFERLFIWGRNNVVTHKKSITVRNAWNSDVTIDYGDLENSSDNNMLAGTRMQSKGNFTLLEETQTEKFVKPQIRKQGIAEQFQWCN